MRIDVGIAGDVRSGGEFDVTERIERRLIAYLAREAEALTHLGNIGRRGEVVILDAHARARIR